MTSRANLFGAFASRPRPTIGQMLRPAVASDGDRLRHLLAAKTPEELSAPDIRAEVQGNLWMLSPEAFRYFLPAFMRAALDAYSSISVFASDLIGALTAPSREHIVASIEHLGEAPKEGRLPTETLDLLRQQQLEWFDSGTPAAVFRECFEPLAATEGAAVLDFLFEFQRAHGRDFPFDELQIAIDGYWSRYRV
jgi:hypothetical protein